MPQIQNYPFFEYKVDEALNFIFLQIIVEKASTKNRMNNAVITYNPARRIANIKKDITALAANSSYRAYYSAVNTSRRCKELAPFIEASVKYHMSNKGFPEKVIESYQKIITEELLEKCQKDILLVQGLAGNVTNTMRHRWQKGSSKTRKRSKLRK